MVIDCTIDSVEFEPTTSDPGPREFKYYSSLDYPDLLLILIRTRMRRNPPQCQPLPPVPESILVLSHGPFGTNGPVLTFTAHGSILRKSFLVVNATRKVMEAEAEHIKLMKENLT